MDTALEILPADYWRYYLMANAPESADSNFTFEHFAGVVNKDLADVLGNFVNRVTKFCAARFEGRVPAGGEYGAEETALIAELETRIKTYRDFLEAMEFRKALGELRAIWVAGNEYLTRAAPWTAIKTDRDRAAVGVRMGLNLAHLFAHLAWPVIPASAKKIHDSFGETPAVLPWPEGTMRELLDQFEPGQEIPVPGRALRQDHRRTGGGMDGTVRRERSTLPLRVRARCPLSDSAQTRYVLFDSRLRGLGVSNSLCGGFVRRNSIACAVRSPSMTRGTFGARNDRASFGAAICTQRSAPS